MEMSVEEAVREREIAGRRRRTQSLGREKQKEDGDHESVNLMA